MPRVSALGWGQRDWLERDPDYDNLRDVHLRTLFAEDPPKAGGGEASFFVTIFPFVIIFVLFYFLLIRPQKREQGRRQRRLPRPKQAWRAPRLLWRGSSIALAAVAGFYRWFKTP